MGELKHRPLQVQMIRKYIVSAAELENLEVWPSVHIS